MAASHLLNRGVLTLTLLLAVSACSTMTARDDATYKVDEKLTQDIQTQFNHSPGLLPNEVNVHVYGGVVYLDGIVTTSTDIGLIQTISKLPGVKGVRNDLVIEQ